MSAVTLFKVVQGEWLFEKILNHLDLSEEELREQYEKKLEDDPTCLNGVIVEMMHENIKRGRKND